MAMRECHWLNRSHLRPRPCPTGAFNGSDQLGADDGGFDRRPKRRRHASRPMASAKTSLNYMTFVAWSMLDPDRRLAIMALAGKSDGLDGDLGLGMDEPE
jgi:hypothetical protein